MLTTTWRRRLLAVLTLPLLVLLAGCGRFTADFEIQDVDTMQVELDIGIETTWIQGEFDSAEELCADLDGESAGDGVYGEVPSEPYEEDDIWGCRASGVVERSDFGDEMQLTEEDGEFHLVMSGGDAAPVSESDLEVAGVSDFEFRMSFTFPGSIIESSGGEVDGNTVTYTDVGEVSQGIDIRAEAGGFPWLIIVVAVVLIGGFFLLVALAVAGFLIYRSRTNKAGAAGAAVAGSAEAGPGGASAPQPSYGQPWGQASAPAAPQNHQWSQPSPPAQPGQPGQGDQPGQGGQQGWTHAPQQPGQEGQQGWPEQSGGSEGDQRPPSNPAW
ncbi:MAG TPA: hypothetical protein H9786_03295 [Candidatus Brachybacterium merdavium]|uniref:LppM domain-containing protein n=1 Tax=Candidatus Brachybacterium merdavium TaxID=2838513 RepID=A0A9D2LBY8_9MICO|nr:hypothetical protein [Candidatus Brachybacterium merdavium]